ncbi:MAG: type II 3-dehydroquinate dehydratase [Candidatus Omnitrophica bacterium]|nr:type II 3-dehydroquinate dehydratase [Candidatus Omnitrophota bacterium]
MGKLNKILVIHGPNLHLLGKREPDIYGNFTLSQVNNELEAKAQQNNLAIEAFQSNSEGEIVEKITNTDYDFLIINPAAYTHTSIAIRDALLGINKPTIEVHLSNIYKREEFRKKSLINDIVLGIIAGFGKKSYFLALDVAITFLSNKSSEAK